MERITMSCQKPRFHPKSANHSKLSLLGLRCRDRADRLGPHPYLLDNTDPGEPVGAQPAPPGQSGSNERQRHSKALSDCSPGCRGSPAPSRTRRLAPGGQTDTLDLVFSSTVFSAFVRRYSRVLATPVSFSGEPAVFAPLCNSL